MLKVKKTVLLLFPFLLLFFSCQTVNRVDLPELKLNPEYEKEFYETVIQFTTYDPYADKFYYDEEEISKGYVSYIRKMFSMWNRETDIDITRGHNENSVLFKLGWKEGYKWHYTGGLLTYNASDDYGSRIFSDSNFKNWAGKEWDHDGSNRFYWWGWNVIRIGPAAPVDGFEYYEIPMRLVYGFGTKDFVGQDKDSEYFWRDSIDFNYRVENPKNATSASVPTETANHTDGDVYEDLRKLDELFKSGILTENEYNQKKEELLEKI